MSKTIFWFTTGIIFYTYFGYPLVMIFLSKFRYKPVKKEEFTPRVSLIVAAYNEEMQIEQKIINCLSIDYPKEIIEIILASDGSTDSTISIIKKYKDKGIKLVDSKERVGKTQIQNEAIKVSSGEILFFSDVSTIHPPDVIKKITRNFVDKTVGCVTGKVIFWSNEKNLITKGAELRLKYEIYLREKQSGFHSLFGATGCIYAIRKELFEPLREDLVSDFVEPLKILEKGYRTVYEAEALAIINREIDFKKEFTRRIRVIQQGLFGLFYMRHLLNPFRFGLLSFSLFSHRLLRWLMPFFLIGVFLSNYLLIGNKLYLFLFIAQSGFYLSGIIGMVLTTQDRNLKLLYPIVYFCMINIAAAVGFYRYLRGIKEIYWETLR